MGLNPRRSRLVFTAFLVGAPALLIAVAIGASAWDAAGPLPPVQMEVLKVALQVLGVALLGGAVALQFKAYEAERAANAQIATEARALEAKKLEEVRSFAIEVLTIYNSVKLARRLLRFHAKPEERSKGRFLIPAERYEEVFLRLQAAQLELEGLTKKLAIRRDLFSRPSDVDHFETRLRTAEAYLRQLLREFEQGSHPIVDDARLIERSTATMHFLASAPDRSAYGIAAEASGEFFGPMKDLQGKAMELLSPSLRT